MFKTDLNTPGNTTRNTPEFIRDKDFE